MSSLFSPTKIDDLFCSSLSLLLILLGCHPQRGVTPDLFYLSDLVCPLFFCKFSHNFFFIRVSPPGGCHPGRSAPLPPSDAAAKPLFPVTAVTETAVESTFVHVSSHCSSAWFSYLSDPTSAAISSTAAVKL